MMPEAPIPANSAMIDRQEKSSARWGKAVTQHDRGVVP